MPLISKPWSVDLSSELYAVPHWSEGYFAINPQGHVCVRPQRDGECSIDVHDVAQTLATQVSFPVLLRFPDILRDRVQQLQQAFANSCQQHVYQGRYTPVYPIKVNQQGSVVETIVAEQGVGLEAGSKPELLAILGYANNGVIVCNGYKDSAYIRMALIGSVMRQRVYIVIEKPSELRLIKEEAARLNVRPLLGVRVRLSSISSGKWQNSGGDKSKFGLHANELLKLLAELEQAGLLDCLQLLHFHMGSQVANIHDIKRALKEAGQFYLQLDQLGAKIKVVDAGGGLGVDYDGSGSRRECSVNYTMTEYAENIVASFAELCHAHHLPHPDIFTESGRAITAHHALLLTQVTEVESIVPEAITHPPEPGKHLVESWHNTQYSIDEARAMFVQGDLSLQQLARIERDYVQACHAIRQQLDVSNHNQREIAAELDEKLADKLFCNFSLFQSMPDIWGIAQVFPIMPIHRLDEQPTRRGVIQDLTCDSDGRIDHYVDRQNIENTLPVHEIKNAEEYILGFFMLGAYQEILGDMHNLFGDTHSFNVEVNGDSYQINSFLEGEHVSDLLDYVHIDPQCLMATYQSKLQQAELPEGLQTQYLQELQAGLKAYTYLEK